MVFDSIANRLLLFGGTGSFPFPNNYLRHWNDLWEYNITSGFWTWLAGTSANMDAATVYGVIGVEVSDKLSVPLRNNVLFEQADTNTPGGRQLMSMAFDSTSNCIWIFGGLNATGGN
jgi:hypothetical protein